MPDATDLRAERNRLAWQCRRGMRELDELLQGYLAAKLDTLDVAGRRCFETLLGYPDGVLLELLMGRMSPADRDIATLVRDIRDAAAA